jgi:methyltransferase (TIGR00027 family)
VGVRSRFFDEYFGAATEAGISQVVLLAAGLDSRAFRLDWPAGTELYEVDQALVLTFKDEVLRDTRPRCARHAVAADLRDDWGATLRAAGFDPARPAAWLAEGLLSFLPPQTERDMFAIVTALSAPGSQIAVEAPPGDKRHRVLGSDFAAAEELLGVPVPAIWQTEPRPEAHDVLRTDGWSIAVDLLGEAARRYGRPVPGVMTRPAATTMLLTAFR